jgi:hypothetical protein
VSAIELWRCIEADGLLQRGVVGLVVLDGRLPEGAFLGRAAPVGQDDRQRHLALAEIVADILAEIARLAAIVERVVDELEGEAQIGAVGAKAALSLALAPATTGPTSPAAENSAAVLALMTAR